MKNSKKITFPTYITLVRLIGAPVLVPFFIVNYTTQNDFLINLSIAILFLLFGLTDFFDGFFARKYAQESKLGACLDHLADKFLTCSACIALVAVHKMGCYFAIVLICREFFVMGLREIALEYDISLGASSFGKLKTVVHIALISWMIINPMQLSDSFFWNGTESVLLMASIILAWGSAFHYFMILYAQLKK